MAIPCFFPMADQILSYEIAEVILCIKEEHGQSIFYYHMETLIYSLNLSVINKKFQ